MSGIPNERQSALLYQNAAKTLNLLDLPLSITLAQQGLMDGAPPRYIFSSPPPLAPYASTEPKSDKARAKLRARMGSPPPEARQYEDLIRAGLAEIREQYHGGWCLPRLFEPRAVRARKRKSSEMSETGSIEATPWKEPDLSFDRRPKAKTAWILAAGSPENTASSLTAVAQRLMANPNAAPSTLRLTSDPKAMFHLPSHANFFLDDIDAASAERWSAAMMRHHPHPSATAGPGQFDLVVLDPPWNNRSARRVGTYHTSRESEDHEGPFTTVAGVLGQHLAPDAVVACWVTNGRPARAAALGAFEAWGVRLVEEWIWLKTTANGEPVTAVDGMWRKPYEVLLMGRGGVGGLDTGGNAGEQVRWRLIVAVPDLHSRKPCLRSLLEPLLARPAGEYRALEVFARYLSHGWSAWGNEVLRFNADGCWRLPKAGQSECLDNAQAAV